MAVIGVAAGDLPPDLEGALRRQAAGEPVRWRGRSSGFVEKFQGYALVVAGAALALTQLGGPTSAFAALLDLAELGRPPETGALGRAGLSLALFVGGVAAAFAGWRRSKTAGQVLWAVTNRRLLRIEDRQEDGSHAWTRRDLLKIDRLNWTDPHTRVLAVTVRGRGGSEPVLRIFGPADLEDAEHALAALED